MNKIYRLIFSKAKGCLVAVAENVSGQGKGKSKSTQVGSSSVATLNPAVLKSIPSKQKLLHLLMCAGLSATGLWTQQSFATNCTGDVVVDVGTTCATETSASGVYNPSSVVNNGTISGTYNGIQDYFNNSSIVTNNGLISGTLTNAMGINITQGGATLGTLSNSGTISGEAYGVVATNDGTINVLNNLNTGLIKSTGLSNFKYGIFLGNTTMVSLNNEGTISSAGTLSNGSYNGIYSTGSTISTLSNSGTITSSGFGINNYTNSTIGNLTNSGTITGDSDAVAAITNKQLIRTLTNSGSIISTAGKGIDNWYFGHSTITNLSNTGTISGQSYGIYSFGSIGTLSNGGMITSQSIGVGVYQITQITNNGTISGVSNAIQFLDNSTVPVLTNNGVISSAGSAIYGSQSSGSWPTITSLTNNGTISGVSGYGITGVNISSLVNTGSISSIYNNGPAITSITNTTGTISTLSNSQGASGSAIAYSGKLPTNYSIIINSTSDYGKLAITSPTGSMAFGIDSSSTVANGTYSNVFTGTGLSGKITNLSGTYSGRSWTLGLHSGSTTLWDLVFSTGLGNITSPTSNLSALGTNFTTTFDGGKLVVDSDGATTASAFTIKKNTTGAIDQGGNKTSHFSGTFADDAGGGTASKLTITNSGTSTNALAGAVTLSGVNTYSGGTKVEAGTTLAVTNPNAIGTGALELVGTSTTSANFVALSSMTITNAIKVEGDPTFTAAPGTTLTISSVIADGVGGAGDVVIGSSPGNAGGGTVELTNINTYTGNTTVDAGNTLVLSGIGSIAQSGLATGSTGVANNGTFNIAGVTANTVSLGKNYTQSSTGTLAMNWYQKLSVAGTASLAGTLSLFNTNSSSYSLGRYTLLTATGGRTGIFGTLNTTNLSSGYSYSLSYDANDAYLTIGPSQDYTQQSLVNTAANLQGTFALQNSILNSSLGYDCNLFGPNGVCISTGGRNTAVQAEGINNTSALLIAAYKVLPKVRIGAYADQNLSTQAPGTVKLGNNTPLLGMFAAWNERDDGTGLEVKASASYGQKTATVTRGVVVTSEPGSGSSNLTTQGAQFVTKYGFAVTPKTIVTPYAGLRYSQSNMAGYTEGASSTVTSPLTYQALNTNATTLLAGASATHQLDPKTTVFASAGVELDTNTANGSYSASSSNIAGLTPINFNPTAVKNRPTATVGAYYDLEKNQRLGITAGYAQTPFKAVSTTTAIATYTIGF